MSHDLTDADLRRLLSAMIGTFPTVIHVKAGDPSPADPGVGDELLNNNHQSIRS